MKSQQAQIDELRAKVDRLTRELARVTAREAKVNPKRHATVIVKPDATIAKGDTDTCSVYTSLEEDTGVNIEATALFADVEAELYAVAWVDISGRWVVGPGECE